MSYANFGTNGTLAKFMMQVQVFDLKFRCEFAAQLKKVQIHRTGILTSLATTNFPFTLLLGVGC